ncbi:MAG: DegV family protein [Lachnospiraceae bacterium]|nr:DegV family protein [Lachnospiraceae bacterium]
MAYEIITDSASNLTKDLLDKYNLHMISYHVTLNGSDFLCYDPERDYAEAGKHFYDSMREGATVSTSLVNTAACEDFFTPFLEQGKDIIFVGISSGLSGTVQAARIAAEDLMEDYPERKIIVIDSMGASLGEGLLVIGLSERRAEGMTIEEAALWYEEHKMSMNHIFTVDDLKYLKKGGRISAAACIVGSILSIKPVLLASDEGKIVSFCNSRGRKKALKEIAEQTIKRIVDPEDQVIAIAHCDAPEDAEYVASLVREACPVKDVIIRYYDICTGTHVGPGTVAIFFMGQDRMLDPASDAFLTQAIRSLKETGSRIPAGISAGVTAGVTQAKQLGEKIPATVKQATQQLGEKLPVRRNTGKVNG